jgi:hypothetical protein
MIDGKKRRAWACMNEVHFGAPIPRNFANLLRAKCSSPHVLRKTALEGARFTPQELMDVEMVDAIGSSTEDVLAIAQKLGNEHGVIAKTGVWGLIKASQQTKLLFTN